MAAKEEAREVGVEEASERARKGEVAAKEEAREVGLKEEARF